jgi:hypothetical protein
MYAIPIQPETLDLIAALNGGLAPQIEEFPTLYLFEGPEEEAAIVGRDQFMAKLFGPAPTPVKLLHFKD